MDTSYLAQQVNTIIGQLHGLFDEIGVSNHDREAREAEVSQRHPRLPLPSARELLTATRRSSSQLSPMRCTTRSAL